MIHTGATPGTQEPDRKTEVCGHVLECLRARADKAAQPTGRFSHKVHWPAVCSQGEEHVVTHLLVHVHLTLRNRQTDKII